MRRLLALLATLAAFTAQAWAGAPASSSSPYSPPPALAQQWQVGGTRTGAASGSLVNTGTAFSREVQYFKHWLPYGSRALRLVLPAETISVTSFAYRGEVPIPDGIFTIDGILSVVAGGTNYGVGDYLVMPIFGVGTMPAVLQVDQVGSGGVIQKAHVVRGGTYWTELADGTGQMAIWQKGYGFGANIEATGNPPDISSFISGQYSGGQGYVAANTFVTVYPTSCAGGTATPNIDLLTGKIISVSKTGTYSGCTITNGNPVLAVSSGASQASLGSGATFSFSWKGFAYAARLSIDPTFQVQTCSGATTGPCVHRTVTASTGPSVNTGVDAFGLPADIFVKGGEPVVTDPLPLYEPQGAAFGLRAFLVGNVPNGRLTDLQGEVGGYATNTQDFTQSVTAFANNAATNVAAWQPKAILVQPLVPGAAAAGTGDSRFYGTSSLASGSSLDVYDLVNGASGWFERAIANTMPFINQSRPGDQLYGWMHSRRLREAGFAAIGATARSPELCYNNLTVNDFAAGATFATVQAEEAQHVADLRGKGCKFVFTDTTDPHAGAAGGGTALAWAEITAGGIGYAANATFPVTIAGGTGTPALVNVSTNASGVVNQVSSVPTIGQYSANPTSTNSCASNKCLGAVPTGGTGSGLTLTLYMTPFTATATQTPQAADSAAILARNAQLRSANMGSYATASASGGPVYDGFIDWNGITENGAGTDTWVPGCTVDGLHAAPMCIMAKAAFAGPFIAAWAAQARTMN